MRCGCAQDVGESACSLTTLSDLGTALFLGDPRVEYEIAIFRSILVVSHALSAVSESVKAREMKRAHKSH